MTDSCKTDDRQRSYSVCFSYVILISSKSKFYTKERTYFQKPAKSRSFKVTSQRRILYFDNIYLDENIFNTNKYYVSDEFSFNSKGHYHPFKNKIPYINDIFIRLKHLMVFQTIIY